MQQCHEQHRLLKFLDSSEENRKIVRRLPKHVANRQIRKIYKSVYGTLADEGKYPYFADFCKFLEDEVRIECGPVNTAYK